MKLKRIDLHVVPHSHFFLPAVNMWDFTFAFPWRYVTLLAQIVVRFTVLLVSHQSDPTCRFIANVSGGTTPWQSWHLFRGSAHRAVLCMKISSLKASESAVSRTFITSNPMRTKSARLNDSLPCLHAAAGCWVMKFFVSKSGWFGCEVESVTSCEQGGWPRFCFSVSHGCHT